MADIVFDAAKGKAAEKVADGASSVGILLLKVAEADATLKRRLTVAAILAAANTEANFTNYGRKTSLTATVTVDSSTNDWTTLALSNVTWSSAGGATNNTMAKLVIFYDEGGTDATRIPIVALDWTPTTNGNDLATVFNATGFYKAV